ncbi:hypothetical protein H0H93_013231 [Arthromyces matolae]|nr:hypothetical protein H0H93_013231 [Arthromyces matolae]
MDVNGKKVKLSIWDTAGQERFRTITSSYYRGAQGVILVYDVANRESFEALPRWYSELETYVSDSVVKILVGNKVDKEFSRQVSTEEGQAFAKRMNSLFIEASAKTAVNVNEAFQEVVEKILATPELWEGAKSGHNTDGGRGGMPGGVQVVGLSDRQHNTQEGGYGHIQVIDVKNTDIIAASEIGRTISQPSELIKRISPLTTLFVDFSIAFHF